MDFICSCSWKWARAQDKWDCKKLIEYYWAHDTWCYQTNFSWRGRNLEMFQGQLQYSRFFQLTLFWASKSFEILIIFSFSLKACLRLSPRNATIQIESANFTYMLSSFCLRVSMFFDKSLKDILILSICASSSRRTQRRWVWNFSIELMLWRNTFLSLLKIITIWR